jgi:hypothetical protein
MVRGSVWKAAVERLAEWEQRDGGDGQTDAQSDGDDQRCLPACHRSDLAVGRADEPQEPELAAAPEPDHDERGVTAIDVKAKISASGSSRPRRRWR